MAAVSRGQAWLRSLAAAGRSERGRVEAGDGLAVRRRERDVHWRARLPGREEDVFAAFGAERGLVAEVELPAPSWRARSSRRLLNGVAGALRRRHSGHSARVVSYGVVSP